MQMIRLKTDKGDFCFESYVDAHAFEDKLGIKAEWISIGFEDTKWFGGYWPYGFWQEAVKCYEKDENYDPWKW